MARPLKDINWQSVEQYIESGCSGIEIAGKFGLKDDTFYRRFKKEYGISYQDYRGVGRGGGLADLRRMLHAKALNNKAPGNATILIFLARCELGMKEPESDTYTAPKQIELDQTSQIIEMRHKIRQLEANGDKS